MGLVRRREGDDMDNIGWTTCRAIRAVFGVALGNLAGVDEGVGDMEEKLPTAHGEAPRRNDIGTADGVELRPGAVEKPTQRDEIRKALGVIRGACA